MNKKQKKISKKAPKQMCVSGVTIICKCGKKIEHLHYEFHDDKDVILGPTGHGMPVIMPKMKTSKNFKK